MTPPPTPPIYTLLAVLMVGIVVGTILGVAGTINVVADSIEARADDGVPLVIDGSHYRITHAAASTGNLTGLASAYDPIHERWVIFDLQTGRVSNNSYVSDDQTATSVKAGAVIAHKGNNTTEGCETHETA